MSLSRLWKISGEAKWSHFAVKEVAIRYKAPGEHYVFPVVEHLQMLPALKNMVTTVTFMSIGVAGGGSGGSEEPPLGGEIRARERRLT